MSGVDVLAVLRDMQDRARENHDFSVDDSRCANEAISAVFELTEALSACELKIRLLSGQFLGGDVQDECIAARAALARIGSAP